MGKQSVSHHKCEFCNKKFSKNSIFQLHRKIHTGQKDHKCTLCTFSTINKYRLIAHIRSHTKEKPFKCPVPNCSSAFAENQGLQIHGLVHDKTAQSLVRFRCTFPDCSFKTYRKASLNNHVKTHEGPPLFKCSLCSYVATRRNNNNRHYQRFHSTEKPHKCPEPGCTFSFKSRGNLNSHLRSHSDARPFACDLCPYRAKTKGHVSVHRINVHSTEKPFKCPESGCKFSCKHQEKLNRHLKGHSGDRPFVCSEPGCDYRGATKFHLTVHKRIHIDEKPFKCSFCPFSTKHQSCLRDHTRVHLGETPYPCGICAYRGKTSSALSGHIRRGHRGRGRRSKRGKSKDVNVRMTRVASPGKIHECTVVTCEYSTEDDSSLAIHFYAVHNLPRVILNSF